MLSRAQTLGHAHRQRIVAAFVLKREPAVVARRAQDLYDRGQVHFALAHHRAGEARAVQPLVDMLGLVGPGTAEVFEMDQRGQVGVVLNLFGVVGRGKVDCGGWIGVGSYPDRNRWPKQ